uniref:Uncharacterized protein n=1 Tax=Aplanochytrium stocchinoi TaxID=215587 RepID=A0A7S3PJ00_9STRA
MSLIRSKEKSEVKGSSSKDSEDSKEKLTPRSKEKSKNEGESKVDQEFSPKGKRLVPSVEGEVYLDKRRSEKINLDASGLKNLSTLSEGAYVMSLQLKTTSGSSSSEIKPPDPKSSTSTSSEDSGIKKGKRKATVDKKRILYSEANLTQAIITYLNKECKGGETQKKFGVPRQTVVMHCTKMHLKQNKKRTAAERKALESEVNKYLEKLNRPGRPSKARKAVQEYLSYSENSLKKCNNGIFKQRMQRSRDSEIIWCSSTNCCYALYEDGFNSREE